MHVQSANLLWRAKKFKFSSFWTGYRHEVRYQLTGNITAVAKRYFYVFGNLAYLLQV